MAKVLIGNFKGPQGGQGIPGPQGEQGDQGIRGSRWTEGTAITGTSTTPTVFSGTGISDALAEDMYLNTDTGNAYRCTTGGVATVAKWVYACNLKGIKGDTGAKGDPGTAGPKGEKGDTGEQGPKGDTPTVADNMTVAFTQASSRSNIATGEKLSVIMGKIKKFFADLTAPAFAQMITTKEDLLATKVTGYVPDAKAVADTYTELNGKLRWKRLGTKVGTDGIDIPENANEICINVYLADSEYPQYYKTIPIDLISDTASIVVINSTYYSSTDYTYITARISKTYVNLRLVWVNGKNVISTTNMVVSYR